MPPAETHTYELPLQDETAPLSDAEEQEVGELLPERFLVANEEWFCQLRWAVVTLLLGFWVMGNFSDLPRWLGLRPNVQWPLTIATILAVGNLAFMAHLRGFLGHRASGEVTFNLWAQIAFDLLALTAVVHCVGSLETYVPLAYVFHIALACIFFPPLQSFRVTALACVLYIVCVILEERGVLPPSSIYRDTLLRQHLRGSVRAAQINMVSAIGIFGIVWYLVSHLSAMVRKRDQDLAETNRRLVQAQEDRTRHMLRTTHQLKAPFAAIDANTQLLAKGHCGELPDDAVQVVFRISQRCRRLASEIQEMLQLANLRSPSQPPQETGINLAEVLTWSIRQMQVVADERGVAIEPRISPASTVGAEDHLKMLFTNLLSNAVNYSHQGGRVQVQCSAERDGPPVVVVEDHGIGIPADKLPHIFDEYYRADEAVGHYKESTGLGLTIVRHVAQTQGIRVQVESTPDVGTRFTLTFPRLAFETAPEAQA